MKKNDLRTFIDYFSCFGLSESVNRVSVNGVCASVCVHFIRLAAAHSLAVCMVCIR